MSDLIERKVAEKALENLALALPASKTRTVVKCMSTIHFLPEAKVRHGAWIRGCECSVCGEAYAEVKNYRFCPCCGAVMDGE